MPTPLRVGKLANCINTRIKKPPFLRNMKATTNRYYLLGNAQWKESFSKHLWFAFVMVFLAEMGRILCCGRAESSSSNI